MKIPLAPRWNMAVDGLEEAVEWMKSLQPANTVFPRVGQLWEALQDCEMFSMARFEGQPSKAQMSRLARGEKVRVVGILDPSHLRFVPLRYDELHNVMVPMDIRATLGYTAYDVIATTEWFNKIFRVIENEP